MTQEQAAVSWKKFYVFLAGNTNNSHHDYVRKLKAVGHIEVSSPKECDYLLVFCPVASRVGTDINEALDKLAAGKPTILVVMHHTFKPDHVVAESRRLVTHTNVRLTVDCLFYEDHFLESNCNHTAWLEVQKCLGVSVSQVSTGQAHVNNIRSSLAAALALVSARVSATASILRNVLHSQVTASQKKFYVCLAGNTNNAHHYFVRKLEGIGHIEVNSLEECDYRLLFCPVTSRVGTDINEALNKMPAGKPTILVVMHHTFKSDHAVAESRRLVTHPDVRLTVDCLFYEHHFLESNCNHTAWHRVQMYHDVSVSQARNLKPHILLGLVGGGMIVAYVIAACFLI